MEVTSSCFLANILFYHPGDVLFRTRVFSENAAVTFRRVFNAHGMYFELNAASLLRHEIAPMLVVPFALVSIP